MTWTCRDDFHGFLPGGNVQGLQVALFSCALTDRAGVSVRWHQRDGGGPRSSNTGNENRRSSEARGENRYLDFFAASAAETHYRYLFDRRNSSLLATAGLPLKVELSPLKRLLASVASLESAEITCTVPFCVTA